MKRIYSALDDQAAAGESAYQQSIKDLKAIVNGGDQTTRKMRTAARELLNELNLFNSDPTVKPEFRKGVDQLLAPLNNFLKELAKINAHNVLKAELRKNNGLDSDLRQLMSEQLLTPEALRFNASCLVWQADQIKKQVDTLAKQHGTYRVGNIVLALVLGVLVIGLAIIGVSLAGWKEKSIFRNPPAPIVEKIIALRSQIEEEMVAIRALDNNASLDQG